MVRMLPAPSWNRFLRPFPPSIGLFPCMGTAGTPAAPGYYRELIQVNSKLFTIEEFIFFKLFDESFEDNITRTQTSILVLAPAFQDDG